MKVVSYERFQQARQRKEQKGEEQKGEAQHRIEPQHYTNRGSVVFIGFHPDDLDFHAAGLAATLTAAGVDVIYVVVTSGEKNGRAKIREEEQRQGALAVGVKHVIFLRRPDGGLAEEYRKGRLQKLINMAIHLLRPYAIVTFCPANLKSATSGLEHPDHRFGAMAVCEAIYPGARQEFLFPWWKFWREPLPGHHVREILWFGDPLISPYTANCYVDTSLYWSAVENAITAHRSQWDGAEMVSTAEERGLSTARSWGLSGMAEEYHRIHIPD